MSFINEAFSLKKQAADPTVSISACIEFKTDKFFSNALSPIIYTKEHTPEIIELNDNFVLALQNNQNLLNYNKNWTLTYNYSQINEPMLSG